MSNVIRPRVTLVTDNSTECGKRSLTFPSISWVHPRVSGRRRWPPRPGAVSPTPHAPGRRAPLPGSSATAVVGRGVGEEVARYQAACAVKLAHEEPIVVHVAVHVDHVARAERQLHLLYVDTKQIEQQHDTTGHDTTR